MTSKCILKGPFTRSVVSGLYGDTKYTIADKYKDFYQISKDKKFVKITKDLENNKYLYFHIKDSKDPNSKFGYDLKRCSNTEFVEYSWKIKIKGENMKKIKFIYFKVCDTYCGDILIKFENLIKSGDELEFIVKKNKVFLKINGVKIKGSFDGEGICLLFGSYNTYPIFGLSKKCDEIEVISNKFKLTYFC